MPIALTFLLLPGILRLRIDDGWTRNFSPEHPIVQHDRWFRAESTGLYQFDLLLRRLDARPWTEPEELRALDRLQARMEALPFVTASVSLADLVRDRAWELGPRDAQSLEHLISEAFGEDVHLTVGGSAERGRELIDAVVSSQAQSVVSSLVISWLALGLASGNWRRALRCVAANAWALALVLGVAGWAGLSLGVASSCFLALGIGVGLDYAIHLAFPPPDSTGEGARSLRLRVLANVGAVGAGLGVLGFSSNPAIAKLGLLIVLSMAASGYAALVFFPEGKWKRKWIPDGLPRRTAGGRIPPVRGDLPPSVP